MKVNGSLPALDAVKINRTANVQRDTGAAVANNATPARANDAAAPAGLNKGPVFSTLEQILSLIESLISVTGNGGARGAANSRGATNAGGPALQGNDARLNNTLAKLAQDPEGAILLRKAAENGVKIRVGDTGNNRIQGYFVQRGNGEREIVINPNAVNFDKTVVHELVHASTIEDGNSQHEEGIANIVGYRVSDRINNRNSGQSDQQIYNNTLPNYRDLQRRNGIEGSLGRLGITV